MKAKHSRISRRDFIKHTLYGSVGGAAALTGLHFLCGREGKASSPAGLPFLDTKEYNRNKYNVLFIISDDLRPQLGCYGETQMVTPHIDRLASQGMTFERSYCQQALCAPSRASLLTGLRPDSTGVYDLKHLVQDEVPHQITLPAYFKQNGYETISIGKIFHHRLRDSASAWSKGPFWVKGPEYVTEEGLRLVEENHKLTPGWEGDVGAPCEIADVPDHAYKDGKFTDYAVQELQRLSTKRFFLGVGYIKPHLPFTAPKKYWDLYDPEKIKLASNPYPPMGAAKYAVRHYGELRNFYGMPKGNDSVTNEQARHLIHGYYACVSFLDAQVGRLMRQLETLHLKENTIVVLWGDNGWKLGTHSSWSKHTNYEDDTRVPLIINVPGMKIADQHTKALVEAVDIYPTLRELCGLKLPAQLMEGTSFVPLLEKPERSWKKAVFSQYPRVKNVMGYAMRTKQYRYVEWRRLKTGVILQRELYDHETDPGENVNVIADRQYAAAIRELKQVMKHGWRGALP